MHPVRSQSFISNFGPRPRFSNFGGVEATCCVVRATLLSEPLSDFFSRTPIRLVVLEVIFPWRQHHFVTWVWGNLCVCLLHFRPHF